MLGSRDDWKVRPGYSSGASSYSGSDDDDGSAGRRERLLSEGSKHSNILALDSLRKEMAADGDLAQTVVRIEVSGLMQNVNGLGATRTIGLIEAVTHGGLNSVAFTSLSSQTNRPRSIHRLNKSTTEY
jgi:hypothetical protein